MNILVVDDNPTNVKLLRLVLESEGQTVFDAPNGYRALELLDTQPIDAIISDILMPKMDGYRLCYEVRRNEKFGNTPFIIYTATYTSPADEKLCLDLGADKYLRKPATSKQILAAVDEAISMTHIQPKVSFETTDVLKEYSERLVEKLEEKNAELHLRTEELRATHIKLSHLLANSPAVLYACRIEEKGFVPTYVSDNVVLLLGYTAAQLTGSAWFLEHLHPEDVTRTVESTRVAISQGGNAIEFRLRHADGTYRWIEERSHTIRDSLGLPSEIVGVWIDISERKRAEEALRAREALLEMTAHLAKLGAWSIDLETQNVEWSDQVCDLLEVPRGTQIAFEDSLSFVSPYNRELVEKAFQVCMETGAPVDEEFEIVTAKGLKVWTRCIGKAEFNQSGAPVKLYGAIQDITDRKTVEEILKRSNDELETLVNERTAALALKNVELQAAKQTADSANMAKSEFLSRMSHEFRTPMNAILGFGQLLERTDLDDSQRDSLFHIMKGGQHLLALINDVLEISRIEVGSLGISLEPVAIAHVVQESVSLMAPIASERGIPMNLAELPSVYVVADVQRLRQVILNLLSNAIKYNVIDGRIAIRVFEESGDIVVTEISDTGIGMSEAMKERWFTPFDRLGVERRGIEGTGLGLSLSKSLTEAMGGTLDIQSQEGVGTTCQIRLNKTAAAEKTTFGIPSILKGSFSDSLVKTKVLVIEDNLTNTELLIRLFASEPNFELVTAMQGRLGLELAIDLVPDIILLDLHLPDMDGKDFLAAVRTHPNLKNVPVVVISADAFSAKSEMLLEAGAFEYIAKPFVLEELLTVVGKALQKRHSHD